VVVREGPAGREVHSGLVEAGAGCSILLEGEVDMGLGRHDRAEADIGAEVDEGSMPSLVVEGDSQGMLDSLLAAAVAARCAADSSVLPEDGETVADGLVLELLWRPVCPSLSRLSDSLQALALFVRQHSSAAED